MMATWIGRITYQDYRAGRVMIFALNKMHLLKVPVCQFVFLYKRERKNCGFPMFSNFGSKHSVLTIHPWNTSAANIEVILIMVDF